MNDTLVSSAASKMKILSIVAENSSKMEILFFRGALFQVKTRVDLQYLGTDSL